MKKVLKREFFMNMAFLGAILFACGCFGVWVERYVNPFYGEEVVQPENVACENVILKCNVVAEESITSTVSKKDIYCDCDLSKELQEYINEVCSGTRVSFELAMAVIYTESRFDTEAVNDSCVGLGQINTEYSEYFKELDITDFKEPRQNVRCLVYFLDKLIGKYGDVSAALAFYNGGYSGVNEYLDTGKNDYALRVIQNEMNLKFIEVKK